MNRKKKEQNRKNEEEGGGEELGGTVVNCQLFAWESSFSYALS